MSELVNRLFAVHDSLTDAGLAHAFGGAIALAYCTLEPRGTRDLDVNIFVDAAAAEVALASLPAEVERTPDHVREACERGQVRLFWDDTPVDVFLNNLPFHDEVAKRIVRVPLEGREIPVLDCASLVVFKAMFSRTKDWADIEAIAQRDTAPLRTAVESVSEMIGPEDPVSARLGELADA